jgi:hypothetical protein
MPLDASPFAAVSGSWPHDVLWGGLMQTLYQVLYIAGPFFLVGLALHKLEATAQGRLSARFGWKSVLWTGWLGTPIHELSHAAACLLFRHRIERVALFEPDPVSGRLGYVSHSYDAKSVYQVAGNFFIGVAPFLGGSLVLYGLLWLYAPEAARRALDTDRVAPAVAGGDLFAAAKALWDETAGVVGGTVRLEHLGTLPFWAFLYGVLCIGSHLAPSPADYKGAWAGGLILLGILTLFNILHLAVGGRPGMVTAVLAATLGPVLGLLVLAAVLSALAAPAVFAVTGAFRKRR